MNAPMEAKKPPEVKPWVRRVVEAAGVFMPANADGELRGKANGSLCAFRGLWDRRRPWAPLAEQVGYFADASCSRLGHTMRLEAASAQGAGLAKSRREALGKRLSLRGHRGLKKTSSQKSAALIFLTHSWRRTSTSRALALEVAHAISCAWNATPRCGRREGRELSRRGDLETRRWGDGPDGAESEGPRA
jgi:hypothetical protein